MGPFSMIGGFLMLLGTFGMMINAMFAFFNLLPVSILDGKKVLAWNPIVFGALFVLSLVMILLSYDYGGILSGLLSLFL
jgi:Zn-dependent protease